MSIVSNTQILLNNADLDYDAKDFLVRMIIYGFILGLGMGLIFINYSLLYTVIAWIISFVLLEVVMYGLLLMTSNSRIFQIESLLADFLSLMSSNIRSGLTPDRALLLSARKEFGPLSKEIDKAAKGMIAGKSFEDAFMEMTERIRSEMFSKTVRLIVEGVKSGGNLADLLEETALDIRKFGAIRKEISATVLTYELFVFAAVVFGAPLLYSVATFLIRIISDMRADMNISSDTSTYLPLIQGTSTVSPELVFTFSLIAITVTAFFGSLTAGVISKGKESEGFVYIPILISLGLVIFFIGSFIMDTIMSSFFMV